MSYIDVLVYYIYVALDPLMLLSWGQFVNSFRFFFVTFRHSMYLCVPNPGVAWRLCVMFLKHRHFLHFFRSLNQFLIGSFFLVMQCWSPSPSIHLFLQSEVILLHFFHVAFCKFIIWQSSSSFNERCFARLVFPSILTYMPPYTCSCKCEFMERPWGNQGRTNFAWPWHQCWIWSNVKTTVDN